MDSFVSVTGNTTRAIEMRYAPSGHGFGNGGVAINRRRKQGDDYVDETSFIDFTILDTQMAENAAELPTGTRVTLSGWWQQRSVEADDGTKRSYHTLMVDDIAVSLRWATVQVHKNEKKAAGRQAAERNGEPRKLDAEAVRDFFDTPPF